MLPTTISRNMNSSATRAVYTG
jgi:hypothetical protein